MKMMKKIIMSGLAVFFLMGLCACGKVTVKINDGGVMTEMEVSSSKTVEQALEEAEITLNEGDEVSPKSDTKVSDAQEIVVSRKNTVSHAIPALEKKRQAASWSLLASKPSQTNAPQVQ